MGNVTASKSISLLTRRKFGEVLLDMNLLTQEQIDSAILKSSAKRLRLGEFLMQENLLTPVDIAKALAAQYEIEYVDLNEIQIHPEAWKLLPEKIARGFTLLPVDLKDGVLTLTTNDPVQILKLENLKNQLPGSVLLKVSTKEQIEAALNRTYRDDHHSVDRIVRHLSSKKPTEKNAPPKLTAVQTSAKDSTPSVEALVNRFLERAILDRGSDIHIDPSEEKVRVRVRIDGILHELYAYPPDLHLSVISRIKVLSNLDISEKRHPQDGGFRYHHKDNPVDIRVSTLPTAFGEKMVLRLLDKNMMKGSLHGIGMSPEMEIEIQDLLERPHGMVFITGPTGSGKTTTLYSMLNQINNIEKNVITVEDPIEFKFDSINQVQVNEKAGLSFAGLLRNILRQDPDVVMIGEVRDQETADLAVRAALTGHLVLSTIHTNDAVSTPTRLMDMGIEPFLLASGLSAVLAQRLVRVLCTHCRKRTELTQKDIELLGNTTLQPGVPIYEPGGCDKCFQSGYLSRIALFELVRVDDFVKKTIIEKRPEHEVLRHLMDNGFVSMRQDGVIKVLKGITSVDEVLRATL